MVFLLQARGICKEFPGTLALDDVEIDLSAGEIHAIMGENGAGKSTLMKILAGVIKADRGEIQFDGQVFAPANPREAMALGIAIVHQELSLIPTLTVAENIFPGRLPTKWFGMVDVRTLYANATKVLNKLNVAVDARTPVERLSIANQQFVEITKAISYNCKILILDEPTSALTDYETETLLAFLRRLASEGVGILYISHKLKEVFAVADRITVLRDGNYIGTHKTSDVKPNDVIRMMVGRELGDMYPPKAKMIADPLMTVENLRLPASQIVNNFTLKKGEILGFAGLIGSGRTELARAIFGADPKASGVVRLNNQVLHINSPQEAVKQGLGYLPEDRKAAGLFLEMSIKLNIQATVIKQVSPNGFFISPKSERSLANNYAQELNVSMSTIEQEVRRLSGGNQQKTLVAKWLAVKPKVFIVDEPTRGIDVGAKKEIHFLLRELANSGVGVIMISSELPEILGMCDRILVMHEGAILAEYLAEDASEEKIIRSASGHESE